MDTAEPLGRATELLLLLGVCACLSDCLSECITISVCLSACLSLCRSPGLSRGRCLSACLSKWSCECGCVTVVAVAVCLDRMWGEALEGLETEYTTLGGTAVMETTPVAIVTLGEGG